MAIILSLLVSLTLWDDVLTDRVWNCTTKAEVPCRAIFWETETDCESGGLLRFPDLYRTNSVDNLPDAPSEFSALYFEREYDAGSQLYYPGMRLEIGYPVNVLTAPFTGFEVVLEKQNSMFCIVYDVSDATWSEETLQSNLVNELFPVSNYAKYRLQASSLPRAVDTLSPLNALVLTGSAKYITNNYPAYWSPRIDYTVYHEGSQERVLEVSFNQPPYTFQFRRFRLNLVPADCIHYQSVTTSQFIHNFTGVFPGRYILSVEPVDTFFSQPWRCQCYRENRLCTNCLTTETSVFSVD